MSLGRNTVSSRELVGYIERIERLKVDRDAISNDERAVMAEAKAKGFVPAAIRYCIKARAKKPHDRQEEEALRDLYMGAIGLGDEGPLFRAVGLMKVDRHARESVVEAFKALVPAKGEIIVKMDGVAIRLWRDKEGEAQAEEMAEPTPGLAPAGAPASTARKTATPPPDVDEEGAHALGAQAFKDNRPITGNPFPFGDTRRARWDAGWRSVSGNDGMGPEEPDGEEK